MTKQIDNDENADRDEAAMASLMRIAGPRAEIPPDTESRVYARVLQQWKTSTGKPDGSRVYDRVYKSWVRGSALSRATRWALPVAVAASIALLGIFMSQPDEPQLPVVGTIARIVGPQNSDFVLGQNLHPGMTLTTGEGQGLSLLLAHNESLRLGENSELRIVAGRQFDLAHGQVYADTGQFHYRNSALQIDAGFATIMDVGTQFAVAYNEGELSVAVREGRVDVQREAKKFVAIAGERLVVSRTGSAAINALAPNAVYWDWATNLAPQYNIENKSLMDFLNWASREAGMELEFENNELRMSAMRTDLHGSVIDFTPLEALKSVLATTRFHYRLESGKIIIEY